MTRMRTSAMYSNRAPVRNDPQPVHPTTLVRSVVDGLDLTAVAGRMDRRLRVDLTELVRCSVQRLTETPTEGETEPVSDRIESIARRWAQRDLPIEILHRAVHAAVSESLQWWARGVAWSDGRIVRAEGSGLIDVLRALSAAVARGYTAEVRAMTAEGRVAAVTLASGLLAGRADGTRAAGYAAGQADSYLVVAVAIGAHPQESDPLLDARVVARRKLRRIQAELATGCRPRPLPLLSVDGGTILIPAQASGVDADFATVEQWVSERIDRLAHVAGAPVTATFVEAEPAAIPRTADLAHELLDLAVHLGRGPGLHRFRDLACEYQLSRPGRANRRIRSVLDPLRGEPTLLETLRAFLGSPGTQDAVARRLGVSVGTLRRRLGRIEALTGLDPETAADSWYLRSSLVARTVNGEKTGTNGERAGPSLDKAG
ncbi:PucR family transcriptional regulator [Nocardia miyunensis]|uniref:PucR family transcriptional regulator n=1 Tax=Nocardia miyunensis TaxID=282684 RepID=UPI000AD942F9|nr:helix-turn-helix domain-containing protein [Nocardia miyunensis]